MTIDEIKAEMKRQDVSLRQLADKLGVNYDSLRLILSGRRALTDQLSRHIAYVLGAAKSQVFVITVDLPEGTARMWAPGFAGLTPEEQKKAAEAAGQAAAELLVRRGSDLLTEEERTRLQEIRPTGGAAAVDAAPPAGTEAVPYPAPLDDMA